MNARDRGNAKRFRGALIDDQRYLRKDIRLQFFRLVPYTVKNGKQEESHSFLRWSMYHIPSRSCQSGPVRSTDVIPGLKQCRTEVDPRSDQDIHLDTHLPRKNRSSRKDGVNRSGFPLLEPGFQ